MYMTTILLRIDLIRRIDDDLSSLNPSINEMEMEGIVSEGGISGILYLVDLYLHRTWSLCEFIGYLIYI